MFARSLVAASLLAAARSQPEPPTAYAGGYTLLNAPQPGWAKIEALAGAARTIPVDRVFIAFFDPQLVYIKGSMTLNNTGIDLDVNNTLGDYGFARLQKSIKQLQAGGVEVFLSMGGWDYSCWPYMFARYSVNEVAQYSGNPNFWKIQKWGYGDIANCVPDNQFCYICEDPSNNSTMSSFRMWPEPWNTTVNTSTWYQAVQYITTDAGSVPPMWHPEIVPGHMWTDPKTGVDVLVPGSNLFGEMGRDPYQDFVYLAKDLGVDGIDLDYEEFYHGDYNKIGDRPWQLPHTVYKFSAIAQDVILNIANIYPTLKLSHAAGATGAWVGNWWGGNLKMLVINSSIWYPGIVDFIATGNNSGGINIMSYDLSDNATFGQCPMDGICSLDQQDSFFIDTYLDAFIPPNLGYEIGIPAFPDHTVDPDHALPLTHDKLQILTESVQTRCAGGFLWELFNPQGDPSYATATETAQAICRTVHANNPAKNQRCSGVVPPLPKGVEALPRRH